MNIFRKLKEMSILLIDDDEWIRDSLSILFEIEGCHSTALETAEEGMKELNGKIYDIIITDYRLPGMNGLEFFKKIKRSHPNAMEVLITAYRSNDVVSEAKRIGIQDFIEKPFTSKTIEESLCRLIENRKRDN
ncbi:MAG: hypothetical protein SRB2_01107 [Desulfobacteraceae bacterium Eth-SRB2]|nr:MAG: hypothetical protein SRB2_01107 [Desulfobacteraceae bacterium Eth-SRB2]